MLGETIMSECEKLGKNALGQVNGSSLVKSQTFSRRVSRKATSKKSKQPPIACELVDTNSTRSHHKIGHQDKKDDSEERSPQLRFNSSIDKRMKRHES